MNLTTDFFTVLSQLETCGNIVFTINLDTLPEISVSVLNRDKSITDKAIHNLSPLNFLGTAEELNNGMLNALSTPLKNNKELFINMAEYEKSLATVKKESKMGKSSGTATKPPSEEETKRKKFNEAMRAVTTLEEKKEFRAAIGQLPKVEKFPEMVAEINAKKDELMKLIPNLLF